VEVEGNGERRREQKPAKENVAQTSAEIKDKINRGRKTWPHQDPEHQ
jgi:hypothetical protein